MVENKNTQGASSVEDRALAEGEAAGASSSLRDCDPSRGRSDPVEILYTNWRGETAVRTILLTLPRAVLIFGSDQWHPEPQWMLAALDVEKRAWRNFALSGIRAWGDEAVAAASAPIHVGEGIALMEQLQRELGVVGPANVLRAALKIAKDAAALGMEAEGQDAKGLETKSDSAVTEGDVPASLSPTPPDLIQAAREADAERARDIAEHQRNCLFEFLHGAGVRLGVIDPNVACDAPQLMTAMDAYFDHLQTPHQGLEDGRRPDPTTGSEAPGRDDGWQPIETAPKDGTIIQICGSLSGPYAAYYGMARQTCNPGDCDKNYPWVTLDETNGTNCMSEGSPHGARLWRPLSPAPRPSQEEQSDA